jgi:hypothetical protein
MEDMSGDGHGPMDRRALLRRGAVLGGSLVWAAPTVQALARPAFADIGTPRPPGTPPPPPPGTPPPPPPGTPPPPPETPQLQAISYVGLILSNASPSSAKVKIEGKCSFEREPGNVPHCRDQDSDIEGYNTFWDAWKDAVKQNGSPYLTEDCSNPYHWKFTVKAGVNYTIVDGVVFGAMKCAKVVIAPDGKSASAYGLPK